MIDYYYYYYLLAPAAPQKWRTVLLNTLGDISRTEVPFWLIFSGMIVFYSVFQKNFMKNSEHFFWSNGSFNTTKIRKNRVNRGYSRLQKYRNLIFAGPEIFHRLRRRFRNYWMIQIFPAALSRHPTHCPLSSCQIFWKSQCGKYHNFLWLTTHFLSLCSTEVENCNVWRLAPLQWLLILLLVLLYSNISRYLGRKEVKIDARSKIMFLIKKRIFL